MGLDDADPAHDPLDGQPVLDPQALVHLREGGGPELVVELIDLFLADGPGLLARIADSDGAPQLASAAHALKGSCLSLGLTQLATVCLRVEEEALGDRLDAALRQTARLPAAYQAAGAALRAERERAALNLP